MCIYQWTLKIPGKTTSAIKVYDWLKPGCGKIKLQKDWGEFEGVRIFSQVGKNWQQCFSLQCFRHRQDVWFSLVLFCSNCFIWKITRFLICRRNLCFQPIYVIKPWNSPKFISHWMLGNHLYLGLFILALMLLKHE